MLVCRWPKRPAERSLVVLRLHGVASRHSYCTTYPLWHHRLRRILHTGALACALCFLSDVPRIVLIDAESDDRS